MEGRVRTSQRRSRSWTGSGRTPHRAVQRGATFLLGPDGRFHEHAILRHRPSGDRRKKLVAFLEYQLTQGPYEERIIKDCVRSKQPLPDKILNAPELNEGVGFFLLAWQELNHDRPMGFGAGPIPSASIRNFCHDLDMDDDDIFVFERVIRAVDRFFLEHSNKKKVYHDHN